MPTDFSSKVRNGLADFFVQQASVLTTEPTAKKMLGRLASKTGRVKLLARQAELWQKPAKQISVPVARTELSPEAVFFRHMTNYATYAEDLLASRAAANWLDSDRFTKAYDAGASISVWGHKIRWRVYTLLKSAAIGSRAKGNFVECGVDRGGTAMAVLAYLSSNAFKGRKFFLFDTFEGLVTEQMNTAEKANTRRSDDRYPPVVDLVRETFAPYPFVKPIQGAVPETLAKYDGKPVAYLHIDMNVAFPEVEALRFFWPLLVPGAPVIFDDYGFPQHTEQRDALDALAAELGTEIMMLPTGQGLTWK